MATHSYLIEREAKLIEAVQVIRELREALSVDIRVGNIPANRDCYGTIHVNTRELQRHCERLAVELRHNCDFAEST
jgi:hypothetical protein